MRRFVTVLLAVFLILSSLISGSSFSSAASQNDGLQDVIVKYFEDGKEVSNISSPNTTVQFTYKLEYENTGADGVKYEFRLNQTIFNNVTSTVKDIKDGDEIIGKYTISSDGKVKVDLLPNLPKVKVDLNIYTSIREAYKFSKSKETFEVVPGKPIELNVELKEVPDNKVGEVYGGKIKWSIDVNRSMSKVASLNVKDTIPAGLTLDENSIKMYELSVSANKDSQKGEEVQSFTTVEKNANAFELTLPENERSYRIEYTTTVNEPTIKRTYTNIASFNEKEIKGTVTYEKLIDISKKVVSPTAKRTPIVLNEISEDKRDDIYEINPTNEIKWEIVLNEGKETIPANSVLRDEISLPKGQYISLFELKQIKVYEDGLDITNDASKLTITETKRNDPSFTTHENKLFELRFLQSTSKTITIEYTSLDSASAKYYGETENIIRNTAILKQGSGNISNLAKAEYVYSNNGYYTFTKIINSVDYQQKTIEYEIMLEKIKPKNVVAIRENLGWAQSAESIDVLDATFTPIGGTTRKVDDIKKTDYELNTDSTTDTRFYWVIDSGKGKHDQLGTYTLKYKATFDANVENPLKTVSMDNSVFLKLYNSTGREYGKDVTQVFYDSNPYMLNNGYKEGKYDADNRKVSWEVGFNYNIRPLKDAVITDTLEKGLQLDKSTLKLSFWDLRSEPYYDKKSHQQLNLAQSNPIKNHGQKFANEPIEIDIPQSVWDEVVTELDNVFKIDLKTMFAKYRNLFVDAGIENPEAQAYILNYDSTFKNNTVAKPDPDAEDRVSYLNSFKLEYGDIPLRKIDHSKEKNYKDPQKVNEDLTTSIIEGSVKVPNAAEFVDKKVTKNERNFKWSIDINKSQSDIEDLIITDTLKGDQVLQADSILVYNATLKIDGDQTSLVKGTKVNPSLYDLKINGQSYEIQFKNTISSPYIVEYESFVLAAGGSEVSNEVDVSSPTLEGMKDTSKIVKEPVVISDASGSSAQNVQILKLDAATNMPMKDITFEIKVKNPFNQDISQRVKTNEDGIATFIGYPEYEATIKEITNRPGYVIIDTPMNVQITRGMETIKFFNYPLGEVTIEKVNEKDEPLENVSFDLLKEDALGQFVKVPDVTLTTDENGQAKATGLEYGTYKISEIAPLPGYKTLDENDSSLQPFTLGVEGKKYSHTIKVVNRLINEGNVVIVKHDGHKKMLPGAMFKLYKETDNGYVEYKVEGHQLTSDTNGEIHLTLPIGNYQLEEVSPPEGYILSNEVKRFTVTAENSNDSPQEIEVINEAIKTGNFILTKTDEEKNGLEGVKFKLEKVANENGEVTYTPVEVEGSTELMTGEGGKLELKDLPFGDYRLTETEALEGYKLNTTPIEFTIDLESYYTPKTGTLTNEKITEGQIVLTKIGKDTLNRLKGVEFDLRKVIETAEGTTYEDVVIDKSTLFTTNDNGEIILTLPFGTYEFIETKAADGYVLDETPKQFTINLENLSKVLEVQNALQPETEIVPAPEEGVVTLIKLDEDQKTPLAGVEFKLQKENGSSYEDIAVNNQSTFVTDANGKITMTLPFGNYQFIETKPLPGYKAKTTPLKFTLSETNMSHTFEFTNTLLPVTPPAPTEEKGELMVIKVDKANNVVRLDDASFNLVDATGKVVRSGTTDATGKLIFSDLTFGTYQLIETSAPDGYQLDKTPKRVTIDGTERETITVQNKKKPSEGGSGGTPGNNDSGTDEEPIKPDPEPAPDKDKGKTPSTGGSSSQNGGNYSGSTGNTVDSNTGKGSTSSGNSGKTTTPYNGGTSSGSGTPANSGSSVVQATPSAQYGSRGSGSVAQADVSSGNKVLPQTGDENTNTTLYAGILFLALAASVFYRRTRQTKQ